MKSVALLYALVVVLCFTYLIISTKFDSIALILFSFPIVGCVGFLGYVFKRRILYRPLWRFVFVILSIEIALNILLIVVLVAQTHSYSDFSWAFMPLILIAPLIYRLKKYNSESCSIWLSEEEVKKGDVLSALFVSSDCLAGYREMWSEDGVVGRYHQLTIKEKGEHFQVELLRIRYGVEENFADTLENLASVVHYFESHSMIEVSDLKAGEMSLATVKSNFLNVLKARTQTIRKEGRPARKKAASLTMNLNDGSSRMKLKLLWGVASVLGIGGGLILFISFVLSMSATDKDIIEHHQVIVPIDLDMLEINKLYKLSIPVRSGYTYVIKRSEKQIEYLKNNSRISEVGREWERKDPLNTRNILRSVRPDLFVFSVESYKNYVRPSRIYRSDWLNECTEVFSDKMLIHNRAEFYGGIAFHYCQDKTLDKAFFIYDLAGRAFRQYMDPLMIPPYFYNSDGKLVIGEKVDDSLANRFMAVFKESDE